MNRGCVLLLTASLAWGQTADPLDAPGFEHFYNLEFNEALAMFTADAAKNPSSPDVYNHIAQTLEFRQMFRSGALESQLVSGTNPFVNRRKVEFGAADERAFTTALGRAMELASASIKRNPKDAGALYAMGVSYGLRSNYDLLVKKAFVSSLRDATAARKMHDRALQADPRSIDARMIQGLHEYIVGSLPLGWKLLGAVAGFHGSREGGIRAVKLVYEEGKANRYDAAVLLAVIYRREKKPELAVPLLTRLIERFPRNYLFRLELADMYGDLGERAKALATIDQVSDLKRGHAAGYQGLPDAKIHYRRGNLLFWFNDLDHSLEELKAATSQATDLDGSSLAYAWLRIGQAYDLKRQRQLALAAYRAVIHVDTDSDAGRDAKSYLSSRYKR